jgi:hypothetical protein
LTGRDGELLGAVSEPDTWQAGCMPKRRSAVLMTDLLPVGVSELLEQDSSKCLDYVQAIRLGKIGPKKVQLGLT